jgi:hypothetical protein
MLQVTLFYHGFNEKIEMIHLSDLEDEALEIYKKWIKDIN